MRLPRVILPAALLTAALAAAGSLPAHAQSVAPGRALTAIPYWTGPLVNLNSGKCLDVYNWSTSTSATIDQWACGNFNDPQANQVWSFYNTGEIQNENSGLCLTDVGNGLGTTATDLRQQPCGGSGNQYWAISPWTGGTIHITNLGNGDLVDVAGASQKNGAWVIGWPENDNNNQAWTED
jgi:hypothetical protein